MAEHVHGPVLQPDVPVAIERNRGHVEARRRIMALEDRVVPRQRRIRDLYVVNPAAVGQDEVPLGELMRRKLEHAVGVRHPEPERALVGILGVVGAGQRQRHHVRHIEIGLLHDEGAGGRIHRIALFRPVRIRAAGRRQRP